MTMRRIAAALITIGALIVVSPQLASSGPKQRDYAGAQEDPARGVSYAGLERGAPGTPCEHIFEVKGSDDGRGGPICSHGPDPAPLGVDVREERPTEDIQANPVEAALSAVDCVDGGSSGKRIEAIYAVPSGKTNRYAQFASSFPVWAANVDTAFHTAAADTGGTRSVRWLTDGACNLIVRNVAIPATGDDSIGATVNELKKLGYNRTDRKYLVWMESNVFCGIATLYSDTNPASNNLNNGAAALYARVDTPCWGDPNESVEAHELIHTMGGVQASAPHATDGFHCTDERDVMCYSDAQGVVMEYLCPSLPEGYVDCNHDSYFNVTPGAGSWLASHWNVASSSWLTGTGGGPVSTTTTTTSPPSSTTTTTRPPSSTTTDTFSGSLLGKGKNRVVTLASGAGTLSATVQFTKSNSLAIGTPTLKLDVLKNNKVVKTVTGSSPLSISYPVGPGTWKVRITRQNLDVNYTLQVTYPTP